MKRTLAAAAVAFAFATPAFAAMTAQEFINAAGISGLFEVESSTAVLGQNPPAEVEDFAQQMITDHNSANAKLKEVARSMDLNVPLSLDDEHQQMLDEMESAQGEQFVQTYIKDQVMGHEDAVQTFQAYIKEGADSQLVNFANTTLPTLQEHLNMAKKLQGTGS